MKRSKLPRLSLTEIERDAKDPTYWWLNLYRTTERLSSRSYTPADREAKLTSTEMILDASDILTLGGKTLVARANRLLPGEKMDVLMTLEER